MKNIINLLLLTLLSGVISVTLSQGHGGHHNPDSLEIVTVSGYAIVDSSFMHPVYYLDEDNDGVEDYHLNFGPYWYEPDSSNATRPNDVTLFLSPAFGRFKYDEHSYDYCSMRLTGVLA